MLCYAMLCYATLCYAMLRGAALARPAIRRHARRLPGTLRCNSDAVLVRVHATCCVLIKDSGAAPRASGGRADVRRHGRAKRGERARLLSNAEEAPRLRPPDRSNVDKPLCGRVLCYSVLCYALPCCAMHGGRAPRDAGDQPRGRNVFRQHTHTRTRYVRPGGQARRQHCTCNDRGATPCSAAPVGLCSAGAEGGGAGRPLRVRYDTGSLHVQRTCSCSSRERRGGRDRKRGGHGYARAAHAGVEMKGAAAWRCVRCFA
jgi:hypothetical protein